MIKAVFVRGGTAAAQLPYAKAIQSGPPRRLHSQAACVRAIFRATSKRKGGGGEVGDGEIDGGEAAARSVDAYERGAIRQLST